eukprot:4837373-Pyramimonas_sp.AAC.1
MLCRNVHHARHLSNLVREDAARHDCADLALRPFEWAVVDLPHRLHATVDVEALGYRGDQLP